MPKAAVFVIILAIVLGGLARIFLIPHLPPPPPTAGEIGSTALDTAIMMAAFCVAFALGIAICDRLFF